MKFSTLWEEFRVPLKYFIKKRIPNEQDTEDILQEVFFKIHSNMGSLKDDNKIHVWIYRITRNAIVDYYRKQNNKSIELMEFTENLTNGQNDDLSANGEIALCLKTMIDYLPEKYKQAITITEFQNLTQKDLSEKLGLSLPGAKSRVQRARAMLKETLLGCCHLEFDRLGNIIDYSHKTKNCKFC
ncbi:MAG: RNA polymerase sigma factor SigZ [Desulfitobacteriaceae bacterium]